jgi:pimeloyl-ACP methyl ester carboxylesterase
MIEVRRYGTSGPCVVLLHGGPGAAGDMAGLARLLAPRFRVLEPLQRSSGDAPLTVAQHVADLDEVLRAECQPVRLVGFSWGAMLALTYAARHDQRVAQIVLIGCGTFDADSRQVYSERMAARIRGEVALELDRLRSELSTETDRIRRDELFAKRGKIATRIQSYAPLEADPAEDADFKFDERGHRETWQDALRLQEQGVQPGEFAGITAPVMMLHGEDDPHPGRMIRDSLSVVIGHLEYHEFPQCGHMPWNERFARDSFVTVLEQVLGQSLG